MGPRGPKHFIWVFLGNNFTQKIPESSDSVFLHFHASKHILSQFYLKRTVFLKIVNFLPIVGPREPEINWIKIQSLLLIRTTLGKMIIYALKHENGGTHGI